MDHLRLEDLSDREVLLIMLDVADTNGEVDPMDVADRLKLKGDHPRRCVSTRLAWLKRWGAVDKVFDTDDHGNVKRNRAGEPKTTQAYRLTSLGERMASGELRAAQTKALEGMGDEHMLDVTRWLTERAIGGGATVQTLVRREWRYRTEYANRRNGGQR